MAPKPSTSASKATTSKPAAPKKAGIVKEKPKPPAAQAAKKLTAKERELYEIGKAQKDSVVTQEVLMDALSISKFDTLLTEAINTLCQKRLFVSYINKDGAPFWKVQSPIEAKMTNNVSDESSAVLEIVKAAGDRGIWTKMIKTKSGLHQTVINKCISQLEGQKKIKNVKSVKYPTRKIYMLEGLTPSIELTGGPWYSEQDLDTEFIDRMALICHKYVVELTGPEGNQSDKIFPLTHTPYLPTAHDVARRVKESKVVSGLELTPAHIEQILKVLVLDGEIQRIKVTRLDGDYDSDADSGEETSKKRKRSGKSNGKKGKRAKVEGEDSDAIDQESDLDDFIENDEEPAEDAAIPDELPPPLDSEGNAFKNYKTRPGPPGRSKHFYVYRPLSKPIFDNPLRVGLTDTPCGVCPVSSECDNRDKPSMPERSLADVDSLVGVGVTVQKKRTKGDEDDEALIRMKPPNGMFEAPKVWMGGGTRGKQRVGLVNPRECVYYGEWLAY